MRKRERGRQTDVDRQKKYGEKERELVRQMRIDSKDMEKERES